MRNGFVKFEGYGEIMRSRVQFGLVWSGFGVGCIWLSCFFCLGMGNMRVIIKHLVGRRRDQ